MDNNHATLDTLFHALSDPTRRAVVQRLCQGDATVSELAKPFGMALPSFVKHMRVLETAGLVGSTKTGRVRTCRVDRERLATTEQWFADQRATWEARYGNLDSLLSTLNGDDDDS